MPFINHIGWHRLLSQSVASIKDPFTTAHAVPYRTCRSEIQVFTDIFTDTTRAYSHKHIGLMQVHAQYGGVDDLATADV